MKKQKKKMSLLLNLLIIVFGIGSITYMYFTVGESALIKSGPSMLTLYTVDSNILLIVSSIIVIQSITLKNNISKLSFIIKMIATTGVTTTMLVVVSYLGFVIGWKEMIGGPNLFLHLVNPLLALISFLFYEYRKTEFKYTILNIIPPLLYTLIMIPLIISGVECPYPFLDVTHNPILITIFVLSMMGISIYGSGILLYFINKKINKK